MLVKYGTTTNEFSVYVVSRFPSGSLICMAVGVAWWIFSPPAKFFTIFHTSFGVKRIWCIALAWCIGHAALASLIHPSLPFVLLLILLSGLLCSLYLDQSIWSVTVFCYVSSFPAIDGLRSGGTILCCQIWVRWLFLVLLEAGVCWIPCMRICQFLWSIWFYAAGCHRSFF